jgi:hypothetical protein
MFERAESAELAQKWSNGTVYTYLSQCRENSTTEIQKVTHQECIPD